MPKFKLKNEGQKNSIPTFSHDGHCPLHFCANTLHTAHPLPPPASPPLAPPFFLLLEVFTNNSKRNNGTYARFHLNGRLSSKVNDSAIAMKQKILATSSSNTTCSTNDRWITSIKYGTIQKEIYHLEPLQWLNSSNCTNWLALQLNFITAYPKNQKHCRSR